MFALYAWMRLTDDLADEEDAPGHGRPQRPAAGWTRWRRWRGQTHRILDGGSAND